VTEKRVDTVVKNGHKNDDGDGVEVLEQIVGSSVGGLKRTRNEAVRRVPRGRASRSRGLTRVAAWLLRIEFNPASARLKMTKKRKS